MLNEGYHEPTSELTVDAFNNEKLKVILVHNRDEEKEHAAMLQELIRRQDPTFDKKLKDYLFTDKTITQNNREIGSA
ncbi:MULTISPECIES: ferritin [unclassified Colwellia]|uniref:ferritin family protein n=1 Tax=unclassified Colwellia TaxID=196834 RepID=UPI0015F691BE|nr:MULTISPECIES: ferritin [unclassified Colwellia]MBA6346720.1 ferritin [Colwellia sp. BRX8-9]MBA6353541.1 ferritin [Colwellia sp. BRX9-1]MBA6357054.1 ferritin [Colwellia sp. BRX8-3]MBA6361080.1 ferritin [Colwellia sp. BRX8-6]MBA6369065.1 ferritin [Colwellia sp. BRX8-5]